MVGVERGREREVERERSRERRRGREREGGKAYPLTHGHACVHVHT